MNEMFSELNSILEKKATELVDAIQKADATSTEYKELLVNFDSTMMIHSNIENILNPKQMNNFPFEFGPNEAVAEVMDEVEVLKEEE